MTWYDLSRLDTPSCFSSLFFPLYQSKSVDVASFASHGSTYHEALHSAGLGISDDLAALAESRAAAAPEDLDLEAGAATAVGGPQPLSFLADSNLFEGDLQSVKEARAHHQEMRDSRAQRAQQEEQRRAYGKKRVPASATSHSATAFLNVSPRGTAAQASSSPSSAVGGGLGVGAGAAAIAAAAAGSESKADDDELEAIENEISRAMVSNVEYRVPHRFLICLAYP